VAISEPSLKLSLLTYLKDPLAMKVIEMQSERESLAGASTRRAWRFTHLGLGQEKQGEAAQIHLGSSALDRSCFISLDPKSD